MLSLLLCQAEICGSPHQTANNAAFRVNTLNIPVCCDCGTVCSHTFLEPRLCPLLVNTQQFWSKERVLIRGQQCAGSLFTLLCSGQFEGRSWQTFLNSLLDNSDLFLLSYPSLALETPSRKEAVVVKDSAGFLCTSSVSCLEKNSNKDRSGFGHCSITLSACLGYLATHQTFSLRSFCIRAALQWELHIYSI